MTTDDLEPLKGLLISRRVRGGYNVDDSIAQLDRTLAEAGAGTLACRLFYEGFATEKGSEKAAERFLAAGVAG